MIMALIFASVTTSLRDNYLIAYMEYMQQFFKNNFYSIPHTSLVHLFMYVRYAKKTNLEAIYSSVSHENDCPKAVNSEKRIFKKFK